MSRVATVLLLLLSISNLVAQAAIHDITKTDRLQNRMLRELAPAPPPPSVPEAPSLRPPRVPA